MPSSNKQVSNSSSSSSIREKNSYEKRCEEEAWYHESDFHKYQTKEYWRKGRSKFFEIDEIIFNPFEELDGWDEKYKQKTHASDKFYDKDIILNPLFCKIFPLEMMRKIAKEKLEVDRKWRKSKDKINTDN